MTNIKMRLKKYYNISKNILFPITRSITGNGIRKTLKIIKKQFPKLKIRSFKSNKAVFDWKIPQEWNITDAYILDQKNKKIINYKKNNLHIVSYSEPVNIELSKNKLLKRLHSLKSKPNAIPYITSYYKKYWGFCLTHNQKKKISKNYNKKDKFKIVIKSKFQKNGSLNLGELLIKGKSSKEILISTYVCHPSMANNELSGPTVSMALIDHFRKKKNNYSIRFVFIPETIGSITYLSNNLKTLKRNVIAGYNLTCIGDERNFHYMQTKYGNTQSDKALKEAYKKLKIIPKKINFLQNGSDERQYNSPGIDLPIASIFRTKYGMYPEYHTSLDNFNLVTYKGLKKGFEIAKTAIEIIDKKIIPITNFYCEPQMSKRNLYPSLGLGSKKKNIKNIMNFIQFSDGKNDIKDISKILGIKETNSLKIYKKLKKHKILR